MSSPDDLSKLRDKIAEAIRGDGSHYDETPWQCLSDERKVGWLGDADRALDAIKTEGFVLTKPKSPEIPDSWRPFIDWAEEAARYFETRATRGEDRAHWANVYNAENARKVADALRAVVNDSLTGGK